MLFILWTVLWRVMDCVVFRYTCVLKVNCEFSGCHQFLDGTVPKGRKVLSMKTHRSLALVMDDLGSKL